MSPSLILKKIKNLLVKEKNIIAYSSYTLASNSLGTIIGIITNLPLSTILGPASFGTLKIITSFFNQIPIRLGMEATLTKYPPQWKDQEEIGKIRYLLQSLLKIRIISILVITIMFFTLRKTFSQHFLKNPSATQLFSLGIITFVTSYSDLFRPTVLGLRNYTLYSNINLLTAILRNVLSLILAFLSGITGAIIAAPLSSLVGMIPSLKYLKKESVFDRKSTPVNIKQILCSYSLPVYLVNLTGLINRLSTPLLALLFKPATIGLYSFALTITSPITLISGAMGQVFFPEVALEHSRNGKTRAFKKLKRVLFIFTLSCLFLIPLGLTLTQPFISRFASGYRSAIPLAKFLFFVSTLNGLLSLTTSYYMAIGKNKHAGIIRLASSVTTFLLSLAILNTIT